MNKVIFILACFAANAAPVVAAEMIVPPQESLHETGVGGVYFDQFNINKDVRDLPSDNAKVRQARLDLRNARTSFERARADLGWDHPQAQSAIDSLQKAEIALHRELGDLNKNTADWGVAQGEEVNSLAEKYVPPASAYNFELDVQDQATDNDTVRQDRAALRDSLTAYRDTCAQSGAGSSQCDTAKTRVDQSEVSLQKNLNALALQNL
jgi:hypothetical protein